MITWFINSELRISLITLFRLRPGQNRIKTCQVKPLLKCASASKSEKTQPFGAFADSNNRCKRIHQAKKKA
ncbi:hypothetical protein CMR03_23835 [Pantoea allii]|nr:hypothetical protein CMR03_23835 [Pantoea allii]